MFNFNSFQNPNSYLSYLNPSGLIIKVQGMDGAKAYCIPPNSMAALFDTEDDIFYIKTTDINGIEKIRKFSFVEIFDDDASSDKYVTIDEFNKFKKELLNGKQHISNSNRYSGAKSFKPTKQYNKSPEVKPESVDTESSSSTS